MLSKTYFKKKCIFATREGDVNRYKRKYDKTKINTEFISPDGKYYMYDYICSYSTADLGWIVVCADNNADAGRQRHNHSSWSGRF